MAGLFSAKSMSKDVPNRKEIIRISITAGFCSVGFVGLATTAKRKPKHHVFDSTVPKKGTKTTVLSNPRSQGRSVCDFNDFSFCTSCLLPIEEPNSAVLFWHIQKLHNWTRCVVVSSASEQTTQGCFCYRCSNNSVFRVFMIPSNTTSIDAWNNAKNKRQKLAAVQNGVEWLELAAA